MSIEEIIGSLEFVSNYWEMVDDMTLLLGPDYGEEEWYD